MLSKCVNQWENKWHPKKNRKYECNEFILLPSQFLFFSVFVEKQWYVICGMFLLFVVKINENQWHKFFEKKGIISMKFQINFIKMNCVIQKTIITWMTNQKRQFWHNWWEKKREKPNREQKKRKHQGFFLLTVLLDGSRSEKGLNPMMTN